MESLGTIKSNFKTAASVAPVDEGASVKRSGSPGVLLPWPAPVALFGPMAEFTFPVVNNTPLGIPTLHAPAQLKVPLAEGAPVYDTFDT